MGGDSLSFLPTIKCSDCGADIEISQLADHVCALVPLKAEEPSSPKLERAPTFGSASFNNRPDSSHSRTARMPPPPRIDPRAANKPFLSPELSPESSYSDPNTRSALSPGLSHLMNRSATGPPPQTRAPSPDLSSNLDSAFPQVPTNRSPTPLSVRTSDRLQPSPSFDQHYAPPSPLFAPLSPRINAGESVVRRLDTIAPGPFAGDRRPSTSNGPRSPGQGMTPFGHKRTNTQSSARSNGFAPSSRISTTSSASRGSVFSSRSSGLPSRPKPGVGPFAAMPPPPPPPPPKDEESEGIDAFLARLEKETVETPHTRQNSRSKTSPPRENSRDSTDSSTRPVQRIQAYRPPPNGESQSDYTLSSRTYDPAGSRPASRKNQPPPIPSIPNYAREFSSDAVHTPSDSGLSEDSYASTGFRSIASSRSSPPISEASHSRQASKSGRSDIINDDPPPRRFQSPEMFLDPRPAPPPPPQQDSRRARSPEPPRSPEPLYQPPKPLHMTTPESPIDPAIQKGLSYRQRQEEVRPIRDPALNTPGLMNQPPPPRTLTPEPPREAARRPTTASKGRCRGCSEQIVGKSIKDSSGRLTGRYHKQCFVCRTCRDPFPTAEFYVLNDHPYCGQHYHQLNGSLCRACNRGIEGQYLETDHRLKFHPRCFHCSTCRIILRDDYFEVGGRHYCERHAYSALNQRNNFLGAGGPGGNQRMQKLEKRRTRMMMMN